MNKNGKILKAEDFFPYFKKEIKFDDLRSISMPQKNKTGIVVGIRESSVEIRTNNIMTKWYDFNSLKIVFYI